MSPFTSFRLQLLNPRSSAGQAAGMTYGCFISSKFQFLNTNCKQKKCKQKKAETPPLFFILYTLYFILCTLYSVLYLLQLSIIFLYSFALRIYPGKFSSNVLIPSFWRLSYDSVISVSTSGSTHFLFCAIFINSW